MRKVPEQVTADESLLLPFPPTLPNVLAHAVEAFAEKEFLVCGERRLTFGQADEESGKLARGLLALGVGKGTRVGIMMANSPDWVLSWLAAARIGALTVPISTLYQAPELRWVLGHSDIDTLLVVDHYLNHDYVARLETIPQLAEQVRPNLFVPELPYLRHVVVWGADQRTWAMTGPDDLVHLGGSSALADGRFLASVEAQVTPADDLTIIYTSGSTSQPKAVVHSHASVVRLCQALLATGWQDVRPDDRIYCSVPFFWIGGINSTLLPAMLTGARVIMTASPEVDEVLDSCAREQVTTINAVTPQLRALEERAASRGIDLPHMRSRLRQLDEAGDLIPPELIPNPFGMTETFGPHGLEAEGTRLPSDKAGAYGRSLPGMERKVLDPATGEECAPGEAGELYVRGFSLMRGFYKRLPEVTFDRDGFYPTGDRCRIDADGFLYFDGRFGEMIKTNGANVSPKEVEAALEGRSEIREAVVFGIPDSARGEVIVAVVVPTTGSRLDRDQLLAHLRQEVSSYKVPHFIFAMRHEDVPRTDSTKVKKHVLKELVLAHWSQFLATGAQSEIAVTEPA
jgi:acyl-coenzyme A synthetase/AMP-(fatty) acid ligase